MCVCVCVCCTEAHLCVCVCVCVCGQSIGMASDPASPEEVAYFLRHAEGLDNVVVGDFLGERDEMNVKVLAGACVFFRSLMFGTPDP